MTKFSAFFEKMHFFELQQPAPPLIQKITKPCHYFLIATHMVTLKHHSFPFNIARKKKYPRFFEKRAKVSPKFPVCEKKNTSHNFSNIKNPPRLIVLNFFLHNFILADFWFMQNCGTYFFSQPRNFCWISAFGQKISTIAR